MGVKSMSLDEGETVISLLVLNKESELLAISENGYGKRTMSSEFRITSRGTKGVRAGIFNEKTGNLVSLAMVDDDKDLLIMANNGVVIRTPASAIPKLSRSTQGVKIMKLREGCKIVSIAVGEHMEEEPEQAITAEGIVIEAIQNSENTQAEE